MGYRNLLIDAALPPDGYRVGDDLTVTLVTEWQGQPLPQQPVLVIVTDPARVERGRWMWRTDDAGRCTVTIPTLKEDRTGTWVVMAILYQALPDGSWDADGWTCVVGGAG